MEILTKRPEAMPFQDYKIALRAQKVIIKRKKKGTLVWLSKLFPTPKVLGLIKEEGLSDEFKGLLVKGQSFVGSTKDLERRTKTVESND